MIAVGSRVQEAISTLRTNSDLAELRNPLTLMERVTGITDLEWLYEVFHTGAARTPEEAKRLFDLELEENYKPFE